MTNTIPAPTPGAHPHRSLPTIRDVLGGPLVVGAPDIAGPLAVFPLFGPEPELDYTSFSGAHRSAQVEITELESGASVNDLTVTNRGAPVLLYEGEELIGAQQNRLLDISLLIAAESKTRIPVSCVEQGRWDGSRHGEAFRPSPQAADPELRKSKARRVREHVAAGMEPRAVQGEVWSEVAQRMHEFDEASPTAAMSDLYERRRDALERLREPIRLHDWQIGAVCAIDGRISILDLVGRPDVWADLHPALVQGYALDALRRENAHSVERRERPGPRQPGGGRSRPPRRRWVHEFIGRATAAPAWGEHRRREAGLGETVRFAGLGVAGSAVVVATEELRRGEELVQLTAHPDQGEARRWPDAGRRGTRVRRPSQRRH